jgi:hypothetical protein
LLVCSSFSFAARPPDGEPCSPRLWSNWKKALVIVTLETVVSWHRAGFRLVRNRNYKRGCPAFNPIQKQSVNSFVVRFCEKPKIFEAKLLRLENLATAISRSDFHLIASAKPGALYFVAAFFTGRNSPYLPCFSLAVKWMPLAAYSGGGSVLSITNICCSPENFSRCS